MKVTVGVLFLVLLYTTAAVAQSNTGTYSITSASSTPSVGTTSTACLTPVNGLICAQLTLSATLNDTTTADGFTVRVDLTPNGSAPAIDMTKSSFLLTAANQAAGDSVLTAMTTTSFSAFIGIAGGPVGGTFVLGTLYIPIPTTARNANTYTLSFPSGDQGAANSVSGATIAMSAGNTGTITITAPTGPAFSAIALNFGSQAVGVSSPTQSVTVTNIGTNSLTIASVATSGTASGDFSQTNNCTTVVASGNCTITVTFTPTASGVRSGAITILDNAANSPQSIRVYGVGVSGSAGASVSLSNIELNFGVQTVNTTSAAKTVTLTNSGGAALTVSGIITTGAFAQTNNCGAVAASATCTMNVTFTPTVAGALRGSVVIVDNATGGPQVIRLLGTGAGSATPAIGLSNVSLNFGNQTTGTPSSAQTITVTNSGSATLTISGVATTGDFAASGCVTSLSAGATCTLSVTFTPTVTGARHGTVAVTDNAAGSPQVIQLFGNGT